MKYTDKQIFEIGLPGARDAGWRRDETRRPAPGQVLVVDFDAGKGGITLE